MAQANAIKPSHRAIDRYYQALRRLSGEHVTHELALPGAKGLVALSRLRAWVAACALSLVPLSADSGFAPGRALSADNAASHERLRSAADCQKDNVYGTIISL